VKIFIEYKLFRDKNYVYLGLIGELVSKNELFPCQVVSAKAGSKKQYF
jgi:hypothetical protein